MTTSARASSGAGRLQFPRAPSLLSPAFASGAFLLREHGLNSHFFLELPLPDPNRMLEEESCFRFLGSIFGMAAVVALTSSTPSPESSVRATGSLSLFEG